MTHVLRFSRRKWWSPIHFNEYVFSRRESKPQIINRKQHFIIILTLRRITIIFDEENEQNGDRAAYCTDTDYMGCLTPTCIRKWAIMMKIQRKLLYMEIVRQPHTTWHLDSRFSNRVWVNRLAAPVIARTQELRLRSSQRIIMKLLITYIIIIIRVRCRSVGSRIPVFGRMCVVRLAQHAHILLFDKSEYHFIFPKEWIYGKYMFSFR